MKLFLTSAVSFVAKDVATKVETKGKRLAFIYTAVEVEEGGKDADWCQADRLALADIGYEVADYTISGKTEDELKQELSEFDVLYVSGGNTFYLLQQAQKSGFVEVVRDLVMNGNKTYIGTSAGSVIAGPTIYPTYSLENTDQAPELKGYEGFNLVNFCIFPHWGSTFFKDLYLNKRLDFDYTDQQVPIVVLTDSQYVVVEDQKFEIVTAT